MHIETFTARSSLPVAAAEAFAWHERPGVFQRLAPPWETVELISQDRGVHDGSRTVFRMQAGPWRPRWIAEHCDYQPGRQFRDVQVAGPFASWEHTHTILPDAGSSGHERSDAELSDAGQSGAGTSDGDRCILEDSIRYALPLGALGRFVAGGMIRRRLERAFAARHRVTRDDLLAHHAARHVAPMKILVSGSTGLVGSALVPFLTSGGHEIVRLVRRAGSTADPHIVWNSETGEIDPARLEGIDAVVHLAGEGIAAHRWTPAQKQRIRDSRVIPTRGLSEAMARCARPPRAFVCASAIGYYGERGEETLTESSAPGTGFLADVCREWEAACQPARDKGIRTVNLRIGVVQSPRGGALKSMLTPFKLCLGGVIGNGRQHWSWVAIDDVIGAIHFALTRDDLSGPVNATAPHPATNREFTKTLGRVLGRPTLFPMPAFAARVAFGEMADDLLLGSARILPEKLQQHGYPFRWAELEPALRHLLGRPA